MTISLPPISVNECWKGRRFKTQKYKQYEKDCLLLLPKFKLGKAPYKITLCFFFSNKASDLDNPIKPTLDILQKKYLFNDCDVYELSIKKIVIKNGEERTLIEIESIDI